MDIVVNLASGFMNLFETGGKTFIGWIEDNRTSCIAIIGFNEYNYCILR